MICTPDDIINNKELTNDWRAERLLLPYFHRQVGTWISVHHLPQPNQRLLHHSLWTCVLQTLHRGGCQPASPLSLLHPIAQIIQNWRLQELPLQHIEENHWRRKAKGKWEVPQQNIWQDGQDEGGQGRIKSSHGTYWKSKLELTQNIVEKCEQALLQYRQHLLTLYTAMRDT